MFHEGLLRMFGHTLAYRLETTPDVATVGITNQDLYPTNEKMYVLFLDYDNIDFARMITDLLNIYQRFKICTFVILSSSESMVSNFETKKVVGNYLVIGLDKLTFLEHCQIQSITCCDYLHKKVAISYSPKNWVMRIGSKMVMEKNKVVTLKPHPILKMILNLNPNCRRVHSRAMINFIEKYFLTIEDDRLQKLKPLDHSSEIEFIEYNTKVKK